MEIKSATRDRNRPQGTRRDKRFGACDAAKAMESISQICKTGQRIAFNPPWESEGSFIECMDTGHGMRLQEENGLYVLDARIAPNAKQNNVGNNSGFP